LIKTVRVLSGLDAVCGEAAAFLLGLIDATGGKGQVSVALSGGSTPLGMFRLLASDKCRKMPGWERVHFFWSDERCVPPEHDESNYGAANRLMLSKLPIPPANIHRIKGELAPDDAAIEYESDVRAYFNSHGQEAFNLVFLGLGEDGHTASLFPGSSALREKGRLAVPVYAKRLGSWRVTLTLPAINSSGHVVFLVSGPAKSRIVSEVVGQKHSISDYPAGMVSPIHGDLTWLLDHDAASRLQPNQIQCG
jgi:6-phosphogluconolactonase